MKKKHIAQLMVPVILGGIMPASYAGAAEDETFQFLVPSTEETTKEDDIPEGAIAISSVEELNSVLNNTSNKRSPYTYWNDEGWDSSGLVNINGRSNEEIKNLETKAENLKVIVKAYKAGSNEYLGEFEGKNEGAREYAYNNGNKNIHIKFTPPSKVKGYYSSAYSQLEAYYIFDEYVEEKDYTYSFGRALTNNELNNGIVYVNMYYYDDIQNGWIQKNGKWCYMDEGELTKGWSGATMTNKKEKRDTNKGYVYLGKATWFYFDDNGIMETGWKLIDGKWYYFYGNGVMAHDTTISGYKLGSNGVWIK